MNSLRKNTDCNYYYYSTCLKGERCKFRHEPSAMDCEVVCRFWKRGNCANQHCKFRHTEIGKNLKMIPYFWTNKPHSRIWECDYSSRHEDPAATDCTAASVLNIKAENEPRARILSKTANRDSTDADFRVLTLDEIRRYKRPHKEDRYSDMKQTAIVTMTSNREIADGALSANKFNSRRVAEHGAVISDARFQTKQNGCNSNYNLQHSRHVFGNKITVTFNTKTNSECVTSAESFKAPVIIRSRGKSPGDGTSNYGCTIPNERSLLVGDLSPKLSYKNTRTEDSLINVSDGRNFLMRASTTNEKDRFDQTKQIKPDTELTKIKRQLKRKKRSYSSAPPPKRRRLNPHTADSPKYSEVTLQENCSSEFLKRNINFCLEPDESSCFELGQPSTILNSFKQCSVPLEISSLCEKRSGPSFCNVGSVVAQIIDPLSQTSPLTTSPLPGTQPVPSLTGLGNAIRVTHPSKSQSIQRLDNPALTSTVANCVLDGEEEGSAVTQLLASRTEQDDTDIDEEMLLGLDEDNMSAASESEEHVLLQIDNILNDKAV